MKPFESHFREHGQGLLEVIIGIGVILAGTIGTITLIISTIKTGRTASDKVVAVNLAREGIEVVRNIRDSNWLKIQANVDTDAANTGIQLAKTFDGIFDESSPKHKMVPVFNLSTNAWAAESLTAGADLNTPCGAWLCSQVFQDSGTGIFYQASTGSPSGPSKFQRLVTIDPICRLDADLGGIPDIPADETIITTDDGNPVNSACAPNQILVGVRVLSEVKWTAGNQEKSVQLEDRLYNWKYVK